MGQEPRVFIINKGPQNYSGALKYGISIYLSRGMIDRFKVVALYRKFREILETSVEEDFFVPNGPATAAFVAGLIAGHMHRTVNLLIFDDDTHEYRQKQISLEETKNGEETEA